MAGKLYNNDIRQTVAYCEGRRAQIAEYPSVPTNPHDSGTVEYDSYAAGVASYDGANPTAYDAQDFCASLGTSA